MLKASPGETLLDVGCGTGYFTRRFGQDSALQVTGIDPDRDAIAYARAHACGAEPYLVCDARDLPFPDASFDFTLSVTALCFIEDQRRALREMLRVARKGFALGLLNRHSLLHVQKGKGRGSGAYHGAHWHTISELRDIFASLGVQEMQIRTAVFLPSANLTARLVEQLCPHVVPWGGFIAVAGTAGTG